MTRIVLDARALQDENYAAKGIGQHTLVLAGLLRGIAGAELAPLTDPLLAPMRAVGACADDGAALFNADSCWIDRMKGDVFINPSPLTHDTAPLIAAARNGLRTGAVVHDFIPLRQPGFAADPERAAEYHYRVASLARYDFLIANSDFTAAEIHRLLPGYERPVITLHCRARFTPAAPGAVPRPPALAAVPPGEAYLLLAAADDPRKNLDLAIQAAGRFRALGFHLVVAGGIGAERQRALARLYPESFVLAPPRFLPRLSDEALRAVYLGAAAVLVTSHDEGFSLPVAEAIALGRPVAASAIPAHAEQIADPALLFDPRSVPALIAAAEHALARGADPACFHPLDHAGEAEALAALVAGNSAAPAEPGARRAVLVGPASDKPSGIALYSDLTLQALRAQGGAFEYVDVDALDAAAFYAWLFAHQFDDIIYILGNNEVFHARCFVALQNVPGVCILHDSRLFEFLLNRHGPHEIVRLWRLRHPDRPIDIATVADWQAERRLLPCSFLEPLTTRAGAILVHSRALARHIATEYAYPAVHYLPFAVQMTEEERDFVRALRRGRGKATTAETGVRLVMLGETEASKGCAELIYALKILLLQGVEATLTFAGKSEEPYHGELSAAASALGLADRVSFLRYVSRQRYLEALAGADIVMQLRYPLFGQVSGPVADAVSCAVPLITTEELAEGMEVAGHCAAVPNSFSPLHIAEAVRGLLAAPPPARETGAFAGRLDMDQYARRLRALCPALAA